MLIMKKGIAVERADLKAGRFIVADQAVVRVPQADRRPSLADVMKQMEADDAAEFPRMTFSMEDNDGERIVTIDNQRAWYICPSRDIEEVLTEQRVEELAFAFAEHAKIGGEVYMHYFIGERVAMQAQLVAPQDGAVPYWAALSLNATPVEFLFAMEILREAGLYYGSVEDAEGIVELTNKSKSGGGWTD